MQTVRKYGPEVAAAVAKGPGKKGSSMLVAGLAGTKVCFKLFRCSPKVFRSWPGYGCRIRPDAIGVRISTAAVDQPFTYKPALAQGLPCQSMGGLHDCFLSQRQSPSADLSLLEAGEALWAGLRCFSALARLCTLVTGFETVPSSLKGQTPCAKRQYGRVCGHFGSPRCLAFYSYHHRASLLARGTFCGQSSFSSEGRSNSDNHRQSGHRKALH